MYFIDFSCSRKQIESVGVFHSIALRKQTVDRTVPTFHETFVNEGTSMNMR